MILIAHSDRDSYEHCRTELTLRPPWIRHLVVANVKCRYLMGIRNTISLVEDDAIQHGGPLPLEHNNFTRYIDPQSRLV